MRDDPIVILNRMAKDIRVPGEYNDDLRYMIEYFSKSQVLIEMQKELIKKLRWQGTVQD